jgi:abhydrolase domain-containing protein 17
MEKISSYLNVSVLGIEYPGYGLYLNNGTACEAKLKEDAEYVYHYCLQEIKGLDEKDILIFGRSMGSGPACWLAGTFNPGALMVMSGYASIRRVAGDMVGILRFIVKEQFDNVEQLGNVKCPTFILHGE